MAFTTSSRTAEHVMNQELCSVVVTVLNRSHTSLRSSIIRVTVVQAK